MNLNELSMDILYEISKKFNNSNKILYLISLRKFRLNIYSQKTRENVEFPNAIF